MSLNCGNQENKQKQKQKFHQLPLQQNQNIRGRGRGRNHFLDKEAKDQSENYYSSSYNYNAGLTGWSNSRGGRGANNYNSASSANLRYQHYQYQNMGNHSSSSSHSQNEGQGDRREEEQRVSPGGRGRNGQSQRQNSIKLDLEQFEESFNKLSISPSSSHITSNLAEYEKSEIPTKVLYFGWFLDEEVSNSLKALSDEILKNCYNQSELVKEFFDFNNLSTYYKNSSLKYHMTAKFCGRKACPEYEREAYKFLRKSTKIHIIGLFFTKKTFGFRIKLTEEQKSLFDERDENISKASIKEQDDKINCSPNLKENEEEEGKVLMLEKFPHLKFVKQNGKNWRRPSYSRAHITIGVVEKVKNVQTGEDLKTIVYHESNSKPRGEHFVTISHFPEGRDKMTIRYFKTEDGNESFVIYPKIKIIAEATFKPFY